MALLTSGQYLPPLVHRPLHLAVHRDTYVRTAKVRDTSALLLPNHNICPSAARSLKCRLDPQQDLSLRWLPQGQMNPKIASISAQMMRMIRTHLHSHEVEVTDRYIRAVQLNPCRAVGVVQCREALAPRVCASRKKLRKKKKKKRRRRSFIVS